MKKLFFILVISIVLLACASVSAEGTVPDPGMSAVLESHAYYGIGYDRDTPENAGNCRA